MLHISEHPALPNVNAKVEEEVIVGRKDKNVCALHVALVKL